MVGSERKLVAAAGAGALDRRQIGLPGVGAGVLDREPRLVGVLAEIDLVAVRRLAQHADVGAGAEHVVLARLDHHGAHLGVLEAQPLHRVVKLDVDAEIVGIELELHAFEQARRGVDVHDQGRYLAVDLDAPMAVAARIGLKVDGLHLCTRT